MKPYSRSLAAVVQAGALTTLLLATLTQARPTIGDTQQQQRTDVPVPRYSAPGVLSPAFMSAHAHFVARDQKGPIGVLFLGDSITNRWGQAGAPVYAAYYGGDMPANFGFGGDKVQNILWRIDNGEIDAYKPAVIVLMAGANNLRYGDTPDQTVEGIKTLIGTIHHKSPTIKVLLLGILPEGFDPTDPAVAALRSKIAKTNAKLAHLDNGANTRFFDFGADYIDPDGSIPADLLSDGIHPTEAGYQVWADAMQPTLTQLLASP